MKKQKSPTCHFSMNRKAGLLAGLALCLPLFMAAPGFGASGPAADFSEGQRDLSAAGKDLRMAEKEFAVAGNVVDEGTTGRTTWSQLGDPAAEQIQPEAEAQPKAGQGPQPKMRPAKMPGAQVTSNTAPGYDGYMGTWVDPKNGDIVTSVIAPTRRNQSQDYQNYPIIIEPYVSGWGNNYGNNWNGGWGNSGWAGPHGPGQQVPGYPFPPAYPGFQPSGQVPGYPFPPSPPGYGPTPPPPHGPNYAPSLPGQGNPPGRPGIPGNPNNPGGLMPPVPPPGPGFGPGQGPAINPPIPPRPNFGPNQGPGYPPLLPPQSGPGNKPNFGPNQGPNFGPNFGPGNRPGFGPGPNFGHRPGFGPGPNFGHRPDFGPGMRPGPGFRPHTELTPPKNPGRPGSMPLVSPNFPPKVQHQPFVDLYRAPGLQAPQLTVRHPGLAAMEKATHQSYSVPGSAQSWEASYWQPGKP